MSVAVCVCVCVYSPQVGVQTLKTYCQDENLSQMLLPVEMALNQMPLIKPEPLARKANFSSGDRVFQVPLLKLTNIKFNGLISIL